MCARCIQIPETYQQVVGKSSVRFQCVTCHLTNSQRAKQYTPYIVSNPFLQRFKNVDVLQTATGVYKGRTASAPQRSASVGKV